VKDHKDMALFILGLVIVLVIPVQHEIMLHLETHAFNISMLYQSHLNLTVASKLRNWC